jgi:peptidoglycan/LPS O-acetylase OafA/YrhL
MANSVTSIKASKLNSKDSRVGLLDVLRSVAIIFVVITHYREPLLPGGSIGVAIFFCLSGYLITKNLLQKDVTIYNFLIRRIFRIFPAYLVVCILHLFILYYTNSVLFPIYLQDLPSFLLFIKMPDTWLGFGVGVFWTLQVELWFYFLIPLVIKKTKGMIRINLIIGLILISILFKSLVFFEIIKLSTYSIFRTFYWMDNLLYGSLIAVALENPHFGDLKRKILSETSLICLRLFLYLIFLLIILIALFWSSIGKLWAFESSLTSLLTGIIIFFSQKYRLFSYKMPLIISYISLMAYVTYLAHPLPLDYYVLCRHFFKGTNFDYKMIVFALLVFLILSLHYFIEKPGIRFGKRFLRRQNH